MKRILEFGAAWMTEHVFVEDLYIYIYIYIYRLWLIVDHLTAVRVTESPQLVADFSTTHIISTCHLSCSSGRNQQRSSSIQQRPRWLTTQTHTHANRIASIDNTAQYSATDCNQHGSDEYDHRRHVCWNTHVVWRHFCVFACVYTDSWS